MNEIKIYNVPNEIKQQLKQLAKANCRSLSAEIVYRLIQSLKENKNDN